MLRDKEHLLKIKFMFNWKFVSICTVCQRKNIKLFLYEYRM